MNDFNVNTVNDVASMLDNLKLVASPKTISSCLFGAFGLEEDELNQKTGMFSLTDSDRIVTLWDKSRGYSKLQGHHNVQFLQYSMFDSRKFRKKSSEHYNYNIFNYETRPVKLWNTPKSYYLAEKSIFPNNQLENFMFTSANDLILRKTHYVSQLGNVEKSRNYFIKCVFQNDSSFLIKQNGGNNIENFTLFMDNTEKSSVDSETINWRKSEIKPATNLGTKASKRRLEDIFYSSKKLTTFCKRCQQISVNGFCNNVCHSLKRKQIQASKIEEKVMKIVSNCTANDRKFCVKESFLSTIGSNCSNRKRKPILGDISPVPVKIPKLHLLRNTAVHQSSLVI